MESKT
jgi:hypothetical protein